MQDTSAIVLEVTSLVKVGYTWVLHESWFDEADAGIPRPKQGDKAIAAPDDIVLDVMRRALANYNGAKARHEDARKIYGAACEKFPDEKMPYTPAREWEDRLYLLQCEEADAERYLIRVVLWGGHPKVYPGDLDSRMSENGWKPHALTIDDELLVVGPIDPLDDPAPRLLITDANLVESTASLRSSSASMVGAGPKPVVSREDA